MKKIIILLCILIFSSCVKNENSEKNTEKINSGKTEELTEILKEDFQKGEKIVLPGKVHFSYENGKIVADNKEIKIEKLEKLPDGLMTGKSCEENEKKENFGDFSFCIDKNLEKNFEDFGTRKFLNFEKNDIIFLFLNIEEKNFSPSYYEEHGGRDDLDVKVSSYKNFLFIDEFYYKDSFNGGKYKSSFLVIFNGNDNFVFPYTKNNIYFKNFLESLKFEKINSGKVHFFYENGEIISDDKEIKIEKLGKLPNGFSYNKEIFCKENQKKENFLGLNFCLEKNIETFGAMQGCGNNFSDLENSICFSNTENKKINIFKNSMNNFSFDFDKNLKFHFFENILIIIGEKEDFMIIF